MHHSLAVEKRLVLLSFDASKILHSERLLQDMRMKFDAEDPAEVSRAGPGGVDRSQGAARAISVCLTSTLWFTSA